MAWEWGRRSLADIRRWPYIDFLAALQALTDSRFSDVRKASLREQAGVADLKTKLR